MGQFTNVVILGTGAGADARSSTGGSTTGQDYTQLNVLNLGNFWVSTLSGSMLASMTASSGCASVSGIAGHSAVLNVIGAMGVHSASARPLSAAAFLKLADSGGKVWMVPLLSEPIF